MCGIAGIFSPRHSAAERAAGVSRMIAREAHRGPDDRGIVSLGAMTIGMCRLAIFDPVHGQQPMATPDGRFHLIFNGAIYNFRELRDELAALGCSFRTECDTEVLLAAFAQWGEACLPRLRGMFAFAVIDALAGSLFLARDALGIKPLYYVRQPNDVFTFASELNALLAGGFVDPEIDPAAVGEYLAWFAVPAPRTIYRGVLNLPPGHAIRVDASGRVAVRRWWRLPAALPTPPAGTYSAFLGELRERLSDTIRAHRLADVPVGAFLSGGLDSSAVVGLMAASGARDLQTFSVVFHERAYSEQQPAAEAARAFGVRHHEELLTGERLAADLPRIVQTLDQPTGDGINTYYASAAARAGGVKVALSGLGGDELFGGYPSFEDMPRFARSLRWWRVVPARLQRGIVERFRQGGARQRKLADFLAYGRDLHELCALRRRVLAETTRLRLLAPEARRLAERLGPLHPMLDDFVLELAGADPIQIVSAWEMRTYMTDVLLRDSDVFSMAHSLELRVPFVDRVLVEWWWNQPRAFRYRAGHPKAALADAVADVVPAPIRRRKKQGFTLPLAVWMQDELRGFLCETFSPSSLAGCPWLEPSAVAEEWRRFAEGRDPQNWARVWTLAMLIAFANRRPA